MYKFKANKGITLIALVITIIILLILAGISISILLGNNSILQEAVDAKEKTEIATEKELIKIAVIKAVEKEKIENIQESQLKNELENLDGLVTKKRENI